MPAKVIQVVKSLVILFYDTLQLTTNGSHFRTDTRHKQSEVGTIIIIANCCQPMIVYKEKQILLHVHKPFAFRSEHKFVKYGNTIIQHSIKKKVFPYQFIDAPTPSVTAVPHLHS